MVPGNFKKSVPRGTGMKGELRTLGVHERVRVHERAAQVEVVAHKVSRLTEFSGSALELRRQCGAILRAAKALELRVDAVRRQRHRHRVLAPQRCRDVPTTRLLTELNW